MWASHVHDSPVSEVRLCDDIFGDVTHKKAPVSRVKRVRRNKLDVWRCVLPLSERSYKILGTRLDLLNLS